MLRAALPRRGPSSLVLLQARPQPQWPASAGIAIARAQRSYADDRTTDKVVMPGSQSQSAPNAPPVPKLETPATPSSPVIPPSNIPKTPPSPQQVKTSPQTSIPPTAGISPSPGASPPPPPPPPSPPNPPKRRRFRRFFFLSLTTLGLAYGGAVYYALISDDFHDFFTEYIPWGEDVVLFFEERAFKRRFPEGTGPSRLYPQVSGENKVTITGKSGASARVSEKKPADMGTGGKHSSAIDRTGQKADKAAAQTSAKSATADKPKDSPQKAAASKDDAKQAQDKKSAPAQPKKPDEQPSKKQEPAPKPAPAPAPAPAAAPASPPIPPIDSLNVENASDPVVQKVAKMLNDVIAVVNADNASGKYSSAMSKAKEDLVQLAGELATYRATESKAAEEKIKKNESEYDRAAKELVARVVQEQKEQEMKWREEFESERERLSQTYDDKVKAEIEATQKVADQKLKNELLQQDIKLQESFASSVRERVETERDARLAKLSELSAVVSDLGKLTGQWNEVVDANLKTQHLVVAVDAVKAALENADRPKPFLQELAALKEVSHNDRVIDAAIASIHPSAYQRGVPTSAQLIDRFRRVATEVRKAALLPEDAGAASHAASFFLSKFMFKKQGLALGEDVESILTRTELLLEEGDLDEAAREMNGLTGWAKVLSQDWLKDCRTVLEVKQALDVIATEARLQSLMVE